MEQGTQRWVLGAVVVAVVVIGTVLMRAGLAPSETDARAFLQRLLAADGAVAARSPDGTITRLERSRIAAVETAACTGDPNERRGGGRTGMRAAPRNFICRYRVATPEAERFEAVLRADRVPAGGPAEAPTPGMPLVDPGRYRVGSFLVRPLGQSEAVRLLGIAAR